MAQADARQWQRYGYPADVRLGFEPAGRSPARSLAAVSFDLGLGGMQLRAAGGLSVGTRLTCRLPDAHGGLALPARVRWCQADAAAGSPLCFRVGVEFEPLPSGTHQKLQAIVSQVERAGEIVMVHLPSWSEPLCAVSEPSERGVRLRLPLPLLRAGSIVRFEPLQAEQALEGRVVSSQLRSEPGSQGAELDLLLSPCEPARKRRNVMYEQAPLRAAAPRREREITEFGTLSVPKTRLNALLLQGAIVSALCWLGFGVARHFTPERVPSLRSRDVTQTTSRTETTLQAAESAPPPLAAAVTLPVNVPVPDPTRSTPTAPVLTTTSDLTEIFIPVRGPVSGLSVAQWVDPPVVVVDLPSGELALSQARYELGAGGVASVRVGRTRGVTQLRVYLTAVLSRFDAVPARGGIVIRLKRDLQSLPH
jgi:hypothetical protein